MNLLCLLLRHRPSLSTILVRDDRFTAFCDRCGASIERNEERRWVTAPPLTAKADHAE